MNQDLIAILQQTANEEEFTLEQTGPQNQFQLIANFDNDHIYLVFMYFREGQKFGIFFHRFLQHYEHDGFVSVHWLQKFMRYRRQWYRTASRWYRPVSYTGENLNSREVSERSLPILTADYHRPDNLRSKLHDESWGDDWMQENWESYLGGPEFEDGSTDFEGWLDPDTWEEN